LLWGLFVDGFGAPADARTLPPPSVPDPERLDAAAAKYGQQIVGPPPAPS